MKRFWKKKVPAFLLALVMVVSLIPAAAAASADITVSVDAGESKKIGRSDFNDFYGDSFDYLEFDSYDDFDAYGHFTAKDDEGYQVTLDDSDLDDGEYYYSSSNVSFNGEYELNSLTFVADDDADSVTLEFDFTIYDGSDEYSGTMEIEVNGGDDDDDDDYDIVYTMDEDDTVYFDEDDFYDIFDKKYSGFKYVRFTKATNADECGEFTTCAYDEDDEEFYDVELDEDELLDGYFYYDDDDVEDETDCYTLSDLAFISDDDTDGETVVLDFTAYGSSSSKKVTGTLCIEIGDADSDDDDDYDIVYTVDEDDTVYFDEDDFYDIFDKKYSGFKYVRFTKATNADECGEFSTCAYDEGDEEFYDVELDEDELLDGYFYYDDDDVEDETDCYTLSDLAFISDDDTDGETVVLEFTAYGSSSSKKVTGTLCIEIGDVDSDDDDDDYDIIYTMDEDDTVYFDEDDFYDIFDKTYSGFKYVRFTKATNADECGEFTTCAYDEDDEEFYDVELDEDELLDGYFYYDDDDVEDETDCYTLSDLAFISDDDTDGETVVLEFTAYGSSSSKKVTGTLCIKIGEDELTTQTGNTKCSILYTTTYGTNVQLNANDFARFFKAAYPSNTLQYVKINGVSSVGGLYYNYYGASAYGTTARTKLTAANCDDQYFYLSPSGTSQYALTELTYVPSGTNYCAAISFTAYGSSSKSISGTVLISVSMKAVSEIYGVVPKNTSVNFPAPSIAAAVASGTSAGFSSIQLLDLPSAKQGTIYVGTGTSRKADTSTLYSYANSTTWQISQLRFVPASGYTGSVEIPYVACNASGTPIAVGKFCLGVVPSIKKFSDVTSTTWCYKYITELASAGVIDGYADGTYKFNNTVTYGAALKLVMLAAGYPEQAPTGSNVFSGYLTKAISEGIITRTNVDLTKPITRLQMAQLAAGALKLDTTNLSSIKPFTDTNDAHAQALNAAGIIEGYFANGTSTYKPNNNLTRGQMSAIVWRMYNYVG